MTAVKNLLETHCNQDCVDIALGYGQCKWVGEQLIYNARKYGLVSKCYRSTFVTASKMTKEYTSSDIVSILFEYSIKYQLLKIIHLTYLLSSPINTMLD